MGKADGKVVGTTQVVNNGPAAKRWNLVVMGDGYTAPELPSFHADVEALVTKLRATKPFAALWPAINVFRVDVASVDSGADNPVACGTEPAGPGTVARTYFDGRFCGGGGTIRRLVVVDDGLAFETSHTAVPAGRMTIVIVNSTEYGGSGGTSIAVYSRAPGAVEIALHEMGHTAFQLADEYEYYAECGPRETDHDKYSGGKVLEANVDIATKRESLKWGHLVRPGTDVPTTKNPNCKSCDKRASPVPAGTVGAFEGARYYHCGIFRPEMDCRMRSLGHEFCAVCSAEITRIVSDAAPGVAIA